MRHITTINHSEHCIARIFLQKELCASVVVVVVVVVMLINVQLKIFSLIWTRHQMPMKGFKAWPMLGTYGHWAVRICLTCRHLLWHGTSSCIVSSEGQENDLQPARLELTIKSRARYQLSQANSVLCIRKRVSGHPNFGRSVD